VGQGSVEGTGVGRGGARITRANECYMKISVFLAGEIKLGLSMVSPRSMLPNGRRGA